MGEYEAFLMEEEVNIPVSVLSLHNVYGAPCDYDPERSQVIPALVLKAINWPDEPFVVWGSGSQGRAFVHTDDIVDALVLAMDHGLGKGVIQIGPDVCISIKVSAPKVSMPSVGNGGPENGTCHCAESLASRLVITPRNSWLWMGTR